MKFESSINFMWLSILANAIVSLEGEPWCYGRIAALWLGAMPYIYLFFSPFYFFKKKINFFLQIIAAISFLFIHFGFIL